MGIKRFALSLLVLLLACSCTTIPQSTIKKTEPKVALVLGGGSAKGFAHVGVLRVLEKEKIPIHMIVGTSVGSLVGAMFAFGHPAHEIQAMAMALDRSDVFDITVPNNGWTNVVDTTAGGIPIRFYRLNVRSGP